MKNDANSAQMSSDLLKQIEDSYKSFSKGQKRIANYICENYDKAVNLTAARLGHIVGVSESTVVRSATELGYKGYPQFQDALEEIVKNKLNSIQRITLTAGRVDEKEILKAVLQSDCENIKRTAEEIDETQFNAAVEQIAAAEHIYIIAGRSSEGLSRFLAYYLNYIFDDVRLVVSNSLSESFEDIHRISEKDVVIGISFPRYSIDTVKVIGFAKRRGAKVIAVTDSKVAPIARYADTTLIAISDMVSIADSLAAPLSVINALIAALSIKKREQVVKTMETLENIWEEFSVYTDGEEDE